ncbi:MAG TPA: hypothetical protein VIM73_11655, partial [Polyangiaceae bacterium]
MSTVALQCTLDGQAQTIFTTLGWLRQRQRGNWTAYVESSGDAAPAAGSSASVVFTRESGAQDLFIGTVRRSALNPGNGRVSVTVVGGAGKLTTALPALDHVLGSGPVPAGAIARAICDDAGEQLSPGVEQALDATTIPRWHRAQDVTAAVAIDLLASYLGLPWRVLPSGFVSIAAETWPAVTGAAYWLDLDEDDGGVMYSPDGAPLLVGQAIDGVQAIEAYYTWN